MHTSCPKCHSSDARYVYPDGGSFCFSCRKVFGASKYVPKPLEEEKKKELALPYGCTQSFGVEAVEWFKRYELGVEDMVLHGLQWHEKRKQLFFPYYEANTLVLFQARNFHPEARQKSWTQGSIKEVLPINKGVLANMVVLVEDPVSAIKVLKHTGVSTMPLLGSDLDKDRIFAVVQKYKQVVVWLDSNMLHKANRIAERVELIGGSARVVYTKEDPKDQSTETIKKLIL